MKDHKVVVRNLWRKVRLDSTKQAVGRANGRKFYAGKGTQSACGTSGPVRKLDRCAEIAGESARGSRRSLTEHCDELRQGEQKRSHVCLRDFIRVDNERALHVGAPGTVKVRKPEFPEGSSDVTVRESLDVLTLRAEEVGTWKAYTDDNYVEPEKWGPPLVDADSFSFC